LWGCVRAPIAGLSVHTKKKCSVIVPSTLRWRHPSSRPVLDAIIYDAITALWSA
jgi:hypothetical protein